MSVISLYYLTKFLQFIFPSSLYPSITFQPCTYSGTPFFSRDMTVKDMGLRLPGKPGWL